MVLVDMQNTDHYYIELSIKCCFFTLVVVLVSKIIDYPLTASILRKG